MELEDCLRVLSRGPSSDAIPAVLEYLVDALCNQKDDCLHRILSWREWSNILATLLNILGWKQTRVSGNASFVLGSLAETELGRHRLLSLHSSEVRMLHDLATLLACGDEEAAMNAAGTIGTLLETEEGRAWVVAEKETVSLMLSRLGQLLTSRHSWIASNSALVIARLSFCPDGCELLLGHDMWSVFVKSLIQSLGCLALGNGMNAAFALGHFCEIEPMRNSLFGLPESLDMLENLRQMLSCSTEGAKRNAAYALSCALVCTDGQKLILKLRDANGFFADISILLTGSDAEGAWFSAVALHNLANSQKVSPMLKKNFKVQEQLKLTLSNENVADEVKNEVTLIMQLLEDIPLPSSPALSAGGPCCIEASWSPLESRQNITYELRNGNKVVYKGSECSYTVSGLSPNSKYKFKLRYHNGCNFSSFSEEASVTTEENMPTAPQCLAIAGQTQTQVKLVWQPPQDLNGVLKGYTVSQDGSQVHCTRAGRPSCIVSGLQPGSRHKFEVMAITSNGYGDPSVMYGGPLAAGDHCPPKPQLTVLGRHEIFVTFLPPPQPLGQIRKYELKVDGRVVYTGVNMQYKCTRLTPDTEYVFTVCALTSEGRSESAPARKRTGRDFFPARAKLITDAGALSGVGRYSKLKLHSNSGVLPFSPSSSSLSQASPRRSRPRSASLSRKPGTPATTRRVGGSSRTRSASLSSVDRERRPKKGTASSSSVRRPVSRAATAPERKLRESRRLKSSRGDKSPTRTLTAGKSRLQAGSQVISSTNDNATMTVSVTCLPQSIPETGRRSSYGRRLEGKAPPVNLQSRMSPLSKAVYSHQPPVPRRRAGSEPASVMKSCYSILSNTSHVPPPEYRARPLPVHLQRQHRHPVRVKQKQFQPFETHRFAQLQSFSTVQAVGKSHTRHKVVAGPPLPLLTVKDIMWGMKHSGLTQRSMASTMVQGYRL
eukprot:m.31278 g.31278  ORF g.31278 m.31278 type:complete len:944 (+) comp31472_c0_seq1:44-2875(+)